MRRINRKRRRALCQVDEACLCGINARGENEGMNAAIPCDINEAEELVVVVRRGWPAAGYEASARSSACRVERIYFALVAATERMAHGSAGRL